jgi:hypothetical protein
MGDAIYDSENESENENESEKTNETYSINELEEQNTILSKYPENISSKLVELNNQSQQKRKHKKQTKKRPKHGETPNSRCILAYFDSTFRIADSNISSSDKQTVPTSTQQQTQLKTHIISKTSTFIPHNNEPPHDKSKPPTSEKYSVEQTVSNRATLFDEYMSIIDKSYNCGKKKSGIIRWCQCSEEMTLIQSEGMFVCQKCGLVEYVIIESEVPNYKESGNEKPAYPYKRVNHLIECLNQFQAKESTEIPSEIYNEILVEIKKNKMSTTAIAFVKMKTILKKLRLNQYYEHIPHIISKITGRPAPTLNLDTEDEIKNMFKKIQEPFARHCPKDRTNFLSYSYVLHKFFQLLKSREKLRLQDKIWKNICVDLCWTFYPSI